MGSPVSTSPGCTLGVPPPKAHPHCRDQQCWLSCWICPVQGSGGHGGKRSSCLSSSGRLAGIKSNTKKPKQKNALQIN